MTGNHWEIIIATPHSGIQEQLVAQLSEWGFDGFEEEEHSLKAFIAEENLVENDLIELLNRYHLNFSKSIIYKQNWNEVWESNFEPVAIEDFVFIRANFHPPILGMAYEIIITPKMSFGTGHHATTFMVIQLMRSLNFTGKAVYDFGTGTGILAILAEKLGATSIVAADNDDWCIENATENIAINNAVKIRIEKIETPLVPKPVDFVLANINKHILQAHMKTLYEGMVSGGHIILSGLLEKDEREIQELCQSLGYEHLRTIEKSGWIAILYKK